MTRAEIVRRAIDFQSPPRLPLKFDVFGYNDCYDVWTRCESEFDSRGVGCDEWGCRWQRSEVHNMGQIKGHPVADLSQPAAYPFPDPDAAYRYRDLEEKLAAADDRYVMFCGGNGIFERAHFLCGLTTLLEGLYAAPDDAARLIARIGEYHRRVLANVLAIARGRVHAVAWADDWGTQQATFISRPAFRRFFRPVYEQMFALARDSGLHVWLHSCGKVNAFIGELIDIGLNVINLQQPRTVGIDEIGREYAGKICFESIVDIQSTYPMGTREEIVAEAAELLA
jgi:uroporphyrinogen decarboxylase